MVWKMADHHRYAVLHMANQAWQWIGDFNAVVRYARAQQETDVMLFLHSGEWLIEQRELGRKHYKLMGEKGLRYALEEFALTPVEQLQLKSNYEDRVWDEAWAEALPTDQHYLSTLVHAKGERLNTVAIHAPLIEQYQQMCMLQQLKLVALLPDFLLLPVPTGDTYATVWSFASGRLMRFSETFGFFDALYPVSASQSISGFDALTPLGGVFEQYAHEGTQPIALDARLLVPDARWLKHKFNVIKPEAKQHAAYSPYVYACLWVFGIALLCMMLNQAIARHRLVQHSEALHQRTVNVFRAWFPEESMPKAGLPTPVLKKRLANYIQDADTLQGQGLLWLEKVGSKLAEQRIDAQRVDYDGKMLQLSLKSTDQAAFERLAGALQSDGLTAVVTGTNNAGGVWNATVNVSRQ